MARSCPLRLWCSTRPRERAGSVPRAPLTVSCRRSTHSSSRPMTVARGSGRQPGRSHTSKWLTELPGPFSPWPTVPLTHCCSVCVPSGHTTHSSLLASPRVPAGIGTDRFLCLGGSCPPSGLSSGGPSCGKPSLSQPIPADPVGTLPPASV